MKNKSTPILFAVATLALSVIQTTPSHAFLLPSTSTSTKIHTFPSTDTTNPSSSNSKTQLHMGLDLVTYLRTEFISAALVTNQTPRSADVCLQIGTDDGRAITFIPRTIRTFITSCYNADSSSSRKSELNVTTRRQITQQRNRRGIDVEIILSDQAADDLSETEDESVDVVISLQAAAKMMEQNMDWKKSVQEAARVLKPGGRFLFVEQTELQGVSYLNYVKNLGTLVKGAEGEDSDTMEGGGEEVVTVFSEVGEDDVDLVLVPHVAGVAVKSEDAGMSKQERAEKLKKEESDRYAELSISAFERGAKKRRKRKKKNDEEEEDA